MPGSVEYTLPCEPAHTEVDPEIVITGRGLMVTLVVAFAVQPSVFVTVTVYTPAAAAVTLVIEGF